MNINKYRIVLASGSPRRREILEQVHLEYSIMETKVSEESDILEPERLCMELAGRKSRWAAGEVSPGSIVIGADTIVVSPLGRILTKPGCKTEAAGMIEELSGRTHRVMTGVCIALVSEEGNTTYSSFCDITEVDIYEMSAREIDEYTDTGEPYDKAGGYGIQGLFARYVKAIRGDYLNVVGLPVSRIIYELSKLE